MKQRLPALLLLFTTGCSGYLADRSRDLADCFILVGAAGPELSAHVRAAEIVHLGVGAESTARRAS